jgi:putative phage-type endonuclease
MSDRSDWLDWRRSGIGASDVAGILGISPWSSPYSVWADKVGITPDDDPTEAMEMGLALEPAINELFHRRTGLYVAGEQTRAVHPDLPWALATLDGQVMQYPPHFAQYNPIPLGNLEAKTTSDSPAKWEEAIPDMYAAQIQWQMFVTGAQRTWVAAIHASFGLKFRVYEVERDDHDIEFIVNRVTEFWHNHVIAGVAPDTDATVATAEALRHLPVEPGKTIDLDDLQGHFLELRSLKDELKATNDLISFHENAIKAAMGDATDAYIDGTPAATWRPQSRTTFDSKAFREDNPDLDLSDYEITTTSRTFRLAVPKKEK